MNSKLKRSGDLAEPVSRSKRPVSATNPMVNVHVHVKYVMELREFLDADWPFHNDSEGNAYRMKARFVRMIDKAIAGQLPQETRRLMARLARNAIGDV